MLAGFSVEIDQEKIELELTLSPISIGMTHQQLTMTSKAGEKNGYETIRATYILMRDYELKKQDFIYYTSTSISLTVLDVDTIFFPGAEHTCALGLSKLKVNQIKDNPASLQLTLTGSAVGPTVFNIAEVRVEALKYIIICLDKCKVANKFPNYAVGNYSCDDCSNLLSNCITCLSSTACSVCIDGYFPDPLINYGCSPCPYPCNLCHNFSSCIKCAIG